MERLEYDAVLGFRSLFITISFEVVRGFVIKYINSTSSRYLPPSSTPTNSSILLRELPHSASRG
jgi:hypothetical protein